MILEKKFIPKHLLKYFKVKEKRDILIKGYVSKLCDIFSEVKRVLRKDGTCWVNISDCYGGFQGKNAGYPDRKHERANIPQIKRSPKTAKSLLCVPEMFLLEMVKRGWLIRNKIIWKKNNVLPSSSKDRFTNDWEYLYFFVKNKKYFFNQQFEETQAKVIEKRMREEKREVYYAKNKDGQGVKRSMIRNKRTVWTINTKPSSLKHMAMYPEELCEIPLKSGCPEFICNKCGEPRKKIFIRPKRPFVHRNKKDNDRDLAIGGQYQKWLNNNPPREVLSNCGCNAGFSSGAVLDCFFGAGTTGIVALKQNKNFIGIELNSDYCEIAKKRLEPFLEQGKL